MELIQEYFINKAEELQIILDGITDPIVLIGSNLAVKRVNKATVEFTQSKNYHEILNNNCHKVIYGHDNICSFCPLKNTLQFESVFKNRQSKEIYISKNQGKEIYYLDFFPLLKDGKVYSVVEKITNITTIKAKEEENLRMRNLASLGTLISGVAHELNNPLTGMNLTIQSIFNFINKNENEFIRNKMDLLKNDLTKAALIVSEILSVSKNDKLFVSNSEILQVILKAQDACLRIYPQLSKNIEWEFNCDKEFIFQFNPMKIERVFINLFKNSLQAFNYLAGKIKIEIRQTKNMVHIFVEDNAGGISDDVIQKVFDPFYSKNKSGTNTGLGLFICHSIVKEHKGDIQIKSYNRKTRFSISLPTNLQR